MIRLEKSTRPSHLVWISVILSRKWMRSSKEIKFSCSNAYWYIKVRPFSITRALCDEALVFSKWISHISSRNQLGSSKALNFESHRALSVNKFIFLAGLSGFCTDGIPKIDGRSSGTLYQAQTALLDYLHINRGLQFGDAEHISKNSPIFLHRILRRVGKLESVSQALLRFFCYHPVNEFEPFFESLGLKPSEYDPLLPKDLMFLSDDKELLCNYYVLCNYGIAREKIGKIYKEATEVFRYGFGILAAKLDAYEQLGLSKSSIIKLVASSPQLLIGEVNREFVKVLEQLESIGVRREWIGGVVSEKNTYDWGKILVLLRFLSDLWFTDQELSALISKNPCYMIDDSGKLVFLLVGLLVKVGRRKEEIINLFAQFPCVDIGSFWKNVQLGLQFLIDIDMDPEDIQKLMHCHTEMFGLLKLKKASSVITTLNVGKRRLCRIIKSDPHVLKKFALGLKISPLPNTGDVARSQMEKRKFLLRLGFSEDSEEMKRAIKVFRGKGTELQERFDFLVANGLDPNGVSDMIKKAPHILNQKTDALQRKIDFVLNHCGYSLTSIISFPQCLSFTIKRVKLRLLMYDWLKHSGRANPELAMSSIIAPSDKVFMEQFVRGHPKDAEVWENLKKTVS